ncbi:MAG TPA: SRPBCC domain-containing protein [Flavisolibacter sp.]|jgi:uncharacterized protein YndB with AHSA1/START domain|nr:SRPBCC domain-containing protein [Flavisolibacter sp.]
MDVLTLQLEVEKEFTATVADLYKSWTEEQELQQWWQPMGNRLVKVTNNLKEGGSVLYEFQNANGEHTFFISGVYKEVKPQEKLVYTWNWELPEDLVSDSFFMLTVYFSESASGSKLRVIQENFANEESVQPHKEGWDQALEHLRQHLETKS